MKLFASSNVTLEVRIIHVCTVHPFQQQHPAIKLCHLLQRSNATLKIQLAILVKHLHLAVSHCFAVGNSAHSESADERASLEPCIVPNRQICQQIVSCSLCDDAAESKEKHKFGSGFLRHLNPAFDSDLLATPKTEHNMEHPHT